MSARGRHERILEPLPRGPQAPALPLLARFLYRLRVLRSRPDRLDPRAGRAAITERCPKRATDRPGDPLVPRDPAVAFYQSSDAGIRCRPNRTPQRPGVAAGGPASPILSLFGQRYLVDVQRSAEGT